MKEKLKIGIVGLGGRSFYSTGGLTRVLTHMDDVEITWVCDLYQDRVDDAIKWLKEERNMDAKGTTDYKDILADPEVDAVGVFNGWEMHIEIATDAMKAGKAVGMEVGGAYSVEDCWKLVRTQEETGSFFMLLENCCYGRIELLGLKLARLGLFGEIVHCSGGYHHDLRDEISDGEEARHYRLRNYLHRNSHNYPTHDLGPIAKVLNINSGNRIVSLASFASKAEGLNEYNARVKGKDHKLANCKVCQGDIVTTMLRCANGETIVLTLDTSTPRPYYSRGFTIRGTKAFLTEDTKCLFIEKDMKEEIPGLHDMSAIDSPFFNNLDEYYKKYENELWEEYDRLKIKVGHGGMDWHVLRAFVEGVKEGHESPIGVYDAAVLLAVTPLSEDSIALGGAPVAMPDFTNGEWVKCNPKEQWKYSL